MGDSYLHLNPMDLARVFQPRQNVEISISRDAGEQKAVLYVTVRAMIISLQNSRFLLHIPQEEQSWFDLFRPGRVISIQTGRSEGLFTFKSKVLHRSATEDGLTIGIESPRIMSSKERRQGPRIPVALPMVFRVVSFREIDLKHLANKIGIGQSENLSKGGITLLTDLKLPVGLILLVELTLENQKVTLAGLVRSSQERHKSENIYAIGIQFLQPGPFHQKLIDRTIAKSEEYFREGLSL